MLKLLVRELEKLGNYCEGPEYTLIDNFAFFLVFET